MVTSRRMTRNYLTDPIPEGVLNQALSNATKAPSAGFSQGWDFLVLDQAERVHAFWECTSTDTAHPDRWLSGMMKAPVVIVPCSNKGAYLDRYALADKGWSDRSETRWPMPFWHMDTAMAALLILQTATAHGLGSCFFGIPPDRDLAVRQTFGIPEDRDPIGAITMGYPAPTKGASGSPSRRAKRSLADVVRRNHWG